jgi:hypothetical protein
MRHWCDPPSSPTSSGESWTCPEPGCGLTFRSYHPHDLRESDRVPASVLRTVPLDAVAWTTAPFPGFDRGRNYATRARKQLELVLAALAVFATVFVAVLANALAR